MRTLLEVWQHLPADDAGLTAAQVADSRARHGANQLTPLPRESILKKFLEKFDEPIIKILLAAALLSMAVDLFNTSAILGGLALAGVAAIVGAAYLLSRRELLPSLLFGSAVVLGLLGIVAGHVSWDGLAVMVAVVLATGVAFVSEYKSDREFEVLNAQKEALRAKVVRDGAFHTIPMEEVVVGDTVLLEMGDEVPADGRLVQATDLYLDQSLMTGESEAVHKKPRPADDAAHGPEQPSCLYRGTQVVDGVGRLVVTEVGDATYLGQIARRLSADEDEGPAADAGTRVKHKLTVSKQATPLQLKLKNLADLISVIGYAAAGAIFVALLIRGIFFATPREVYWPVSGEELLAVARHLLAYFMYMVIVIVVAVPEGLPMSVTVSLALAMRKMTRANSLVRQLVACETIGSATVICSDKTGTLTQNKMQVVRLGFAGKVCDRGEGAFRFSIADFRLPEPVVAIENRQSKSENQKWLALNAAVNSTANLEDKKGKLVVVGSSTEGALLHWLRESGVEYARARRENPPVYQVHFSSERKRMTTVVRAGGRLVALVKGAPEWVLQQSTHSLSDDGTPRPWTPESRQKVEGQLYDAAASAMRTLAFGYAVLPLETPETEDELHARRDILEERLVFVGFVAIRDPLRDDVKDAVALCRQAGIRVQMITGDSVETAKAIAFDVGLLNRRDAAVNTPDAAVMTSDHFNELSDDELKRRLPQLNVLARAKPLDKYRMVRLLQEQGEVVAVTGDGTNDAPALKKADVGLAMGITGTEVAKEASKIVLLDDAFSTIVKAVHWGRSLYENIQRFIQFQLTINVSALVIAFLGPFFGVKPPFTVLQLLWINVIMDTFAAIALCSEPPRPGLMRLPPKRRDESILSRPMVVTIFSTAAFFVVVMMTLLLGMENGWWLEDPDGERSKSYPELTYWQVATFFSVYVFFQVWNEINCRSLVPETSGLTGLLRNPVFLGIVLLIVLGQVIIVTLGGDIFEVRPLGVLTWFGIAAGTASVLLYAEIVRRVRLKLRSA